MQWLIRRPSLVAALLLALAIAATAAWRMRGPSVATARVERMDLEQHLVASGRVWVPSRVSVSSQLAGLVVEVGAVEGQRVHAGDLLVRIDDAEVRAALAQAKAAVDQAAARVQQLRKVGAIVATEAYRQAETSLERAEAELDRNERLAASGSINIAALDQTRQDVEIARAQKRAAQAQQIAAAPLGAESRVALSALLQSQAQLAAATARLDQTRIVARQDGLILSRSVEPGDVVQPARTLLLMAADAKPELVIEPDERNLAWIRIGQPARASADAYPQSGFDAVVRYIAPAVDPQRGSVEVRLAVQQPPDFLKPDMTVSVDLTVASKRRVLTLPSEAIRDSATATPWAFVAPHGQVARRDLRLGIRGAGRTEITSGLVEGAEVLVPGAQPLTLGQRVRPEREAR